MKTSFYFTKKYFLQHIILFFLLFSATLPAQGQEGSPLQTLLSKIEKKVADTGTVQAAFNQQRFLKIFLKPVTFKGKLILQRPDKLRWENISPIPSVLIFSGAQGIRCNADAKPVHFDLQTDPVMKMVAQQIWAWADSSYNKLQDQYSLKLKEANVIELKPLDEKMAAAIDSIQVRFQDTTLQPEEIIILEPENDKTIISFSNYTLNETIEDQQFTTCFPL